MEFVKMHAALNDYVYCDYEKVKSYDFSSLAIAVSKRHFSIGADGLIIVKKLNQTSAQMIMFNADGSRGATCGNGVRCSAFFAKKYLGLVGDEIVIKTDSNQTTVQLYKKDGKVFARADMGCVKEINSSLKIALALQKIGLYVDYRQVFQMDTGNKHLVFFYPNHSLFSLASAVEKTKLFPDGINVERVYKISNDGCLTRIYGEVFERGSGKTLSCGSGACAIFSSFRLFSKGEDNLAEVITDGGCLTVERKGQRTFLQSPINEVFKGDLFTENIDEIQPKF